MSYSAAAHAAIIDWFGPFTSADDAVAWVKAHPHLVPGANSTAASPLPTDKRKPSGMYLAVGSLSLWKLRRPWRWLFQSSRVQYVGIGNVEARLKKKGHPIRAFMARVDQIWVGAMGTF